MRPSFSLGSLVGLIVLAVLPDLSSQTPVAPYAELELLPDVNASNRPGEQSEVSIAVDPFRPHVVVAAAMNLPEGSTLVMASDNAGETWHQVEVPKSAGAVIHADPMVAFDTRGRAYLAHIPVGPGNTPLGIMVNVSDDGGRAWSEPITLSQATDRDDKVALAVDESPTSPFRDRVYVAWKWPSGGVYVVRSTDRGRHFSRPRLADTGRVTGLDLASSVDGLVYLAFHDHPRRAIRVLRSSNGGRDFEDPVDVAPVRAGWYTASPSHCTRQSLVHASLGVDRSRGPHRDRVYITWSDYREGLTEAACTNACDVTSPCLASVYVSHSEDRGGSWSPPLEVARGSIGVDRYHQWLDVDPEDGSVYVAYKQSGEASRRGETDVHLSWSADGGKTFAGSLRLSGEPSDARRSSFQYGDYQGLAAGHGYVYAAWADFRLADVLPALASEVYVGRTRRR